MGSYAECWLGPIEVAQSKNDVALYLIPLFRDRDKTVCTDANEVKIAPEIVTKRFDPDWVPDEEYPLVYLEAPARDVADRLDAMGYTIETSRIAFDEWIRREIKSCRENLSQYTNKASQSSENLSTYTTMQEHYRSEIEILSCLSVEQWLANLRQIVDQGLDRASSPSNENPQESAVIDYMLSKNWYGFPEWEPFIPMRLILNEFPEFGNLVYDVSDLVHSGYFDADESFVEYALQETSSDFSTHAKTIVLTEGRSDVLVLERGLKLLYPHMVDYYSFLDFESAKIGGGVGALQNMVKVFAGSGIVNRVIAIFDNDTAARAATRALSQLSIPENVVILHLPDIPFLTRYPTIGPTGTDIQDVNGIAGSIELYLGADVLTDPSGELYPVQWMGFDNSLGRYQGQVREKAEIQEKFEQKLRNVGAADETWDDLRQVFRALFGAFHDVQRQKIVNLPMELEAQGIPY